QEELKMTEDQVAKVTAAATKQREAMQGLRDLDRQEQLKKMQEMNKESEKTAAEILKPDQAKRFQQIALQQKRTRAFTDEAVVKELKLTDEQQKKIKDIQDEAAKQRRELFGQGGGAAAADARQKMEELNKKTD